MRRLSITLVLAMGLIYSNNTIAQLNFKVGYGLGFVDAPVNDAIIALHNASQDGYSVPFEPLNMLHGFEMAFRQRYNNVSLETGWKIQRNMLKAEGEDAGGSVYENQITYNMQAISAGFYQHFGQLSFGGTIDYNWLRMKWVFAQPELDDQLKDKLFSSDFSFRYTFRTQGVVALSFQPFVRVHWGHYDISALDNAINEHTSTEPLLENFYSYGITLVMYNGRQ